MAEAAESKTVTEEPTSVPASSSSSVVNHLVLTGFGQFGSVKSNPSSILMKELPSLVSSEKWFDGSKVKVVFHPTTVFTVAVKAMKEEFDALRTRIYSEIDKMNAEESEGLSHRVFWLHLGVYSGLQCFHLESTGHNCADFRAPDEQGLVLRDTPIDPAIKDTSSTLTSKLCKALPSLCSSISQELLDCKTAAGETVIAKVSTDPGRYLCNYLFYFSMMVSRQRDTSVKSASDEEEKEESALSAPSLSKIEDFVLFIHIPQFTDIFKSDQIQFVHSLLNNIVKL